jgi:hypothetical protein
MCLPFDKDRFSNKLESAAVSEAVRRFARRLSEGRFIGNVFLIIVVFRTAMCKHMTMHQHDKQNVVRKTISVFAILHFVCVEFGLFSIKTQNTAKSEEVRSSDRSWSEGPNFVSERCQEVF